MSDHRHPAAWRPVSVTTSTVGALTVRLWWDLIDGRPSVVGLEAWGRQPPGPEDLQDADFRTFYDSSTTHEGAPRAVTTSAVRNLNVAGLADLHRRANAVAFERMVTDAPGPIERAAMRARAAQAVPGSRGRTLAHYEAVARVYNAAWAAGELPTLAVAQTWSVSKSVASKWVSHCRNHLGLIAPTTKGKAAGAKKGTE